MRSVLLPGSQYGLVDGDKGFLCLINTLTPNQMIHAKTRTDLFKIEYNSDPPHELMIQALHWTSKPLFFCSLPRPPTSDKFGAYLPSGSVSLRVRSNKGE